MFLALDVGNSMVKAGLHDGTAWRSTRDFVTEPLSDWSAMLRDWVGPTPVEGAGLASVVPRMTAVIAEAVERTLAVRLEAVRADGPLPFAMGYRTPETLGADRIAAAAAAWLHFGHDSEGRPRPVLALDAGTAVTTEVVTAEGLYLGGAIAPGAPLLHRSLVEQTAQLPEVSWPEAFGPIGASTEEAIQAGLGVLFLDGVRGLLDRTAAALAAPPFVVATGGGAHWLAERLAGIDAVEPHLVLDGIRLLTAGERG